jgi:hypothetical protein
VLALILITIVSLTLTAVMGVITWRIVGEERSRAAARVQSLEHDLRDDSPAVDVTPVSTAFLTAEPPRTGERVGLVLAIGALVFFIVGGLAVAVSSSVRASNSTARASQGAAAPLELVALEHDRDGDRLTVRGTVRNPKDARPLDGVMVTVTVYDRDGGRVASGRAALAEQRLLPGGASTFLVDVAAVTAVARYRVSFVSDERVLPHVDRRPTGEHQ